MALCGWHRLRFLHHTFMWKLHFLPGGDDGISCIQRWERCVPKQGRSCRSSAQNCLICTIHNLFNSYFFNYSLLKACIKYPNKILGASWYCHVCFYLEVLPQILPCTPHFIGICYAGLVTSPSHKKLINSTAPSL